MQGGGYDITGIPVSSCGATVTIRVTVAVTLRAEVQHAFGSDTGLSSRRLLRLHLLQLRVRWRWGYG